MCSWRTRFPIAARRNRPVAGASMTPPAGSISAGPGRVETGRPSAGSTSSTSVWSTPASAIAVAQSGAAGPVSTVVCWPTSLLPARCVQSAHRPAAEAAYATRPEPPWASRKIRELPADRAAIGAPVSNTVASEPCRSSAYAVERPTTPAPTTAVRICICGLAADLQLRRDEHTDVLVLVDLRARRLVLLDDLVQLVLVVGLAAGRDVELTGPAEAPHQLPRLVHAHAREVRHVERVVVLLLAVRHGQRDRGALRLLARRVLGDDLARRPVGVLLLLLDLVVGVLELGLGRVEVLAVDVRHGRVLLLLAHRQLDRGALDDLRGRGRVLRGDLADLVLVVDLFLVDVRVDDQAGLHQLGLRVVRVGADDVGHRDLVGFLADDEDELVVLVHLGARLGGRVRSE